MYFGEGYHKFYKVRGRLASPLLFIFAPSLLYYQNEASTQEVQLPSAGRLCTCKRVVHTDQWLNTLSYYLGFALGFVVGSVLGLALVQYPFYVTNPSGHDPLPRPDHGWGAAYM